MIATILAWVFGLALVGLIVAGLVRGRHRKTPSAGLFLSPSDDPAQAQQAELQRGQLQALHNGQQVGPGGLGG
jgi:hypothetical protein